MHNLFDNTTTIYHHMSASADVGLLVLMSACNVDLIHIHIAHQWYFLEDGIIGEDLFINHLQLFQYLRTP